MQKYFKRFIGIRKKLIYYFLLTIFLLGGTSLIAYFTALFVTTNTEEIVNDYTYLNTLKNNVSELNLELEKYLISASSDDLLRYYEYYNKLNNIAARIPRKMSFNSDIMVHKDIGYMVEALLEETEKAVISKRSRISSQYTKHFTRSNEISGYIDFYIQEMLNNRLSAGSVRYDSLNKTIGMLFVVNLVLIVSMVFISLWMAVRSTYKLTHPLTELSHSAEEIAKGNFNIEVSQTHTGDEIDILAGAFIKMADSVRGHIDDLMAQAEMENRLREQEMQNFKMQALVKESELKFLQSQINPHFLFNTLNAAAQLAVIEDAERTSEFVQNIADVFRYNLKNLDELVSLKEEIEFVKNYMMILKMRFGDRISYESAIEPTTLHMKIPRITIQPIIENAYIHGLQHLERSGVIKVEAYVEERFLKIVIADNGSGMTQAQVARLLQNESRETDKKHLSGIGINNVVKRLKLLFQIVDTSQVIQIESEIDKGTKVTLTLPLRDN